MATIRRRPRRKGGEGFSVLFRDEYGYQASRIFESLADAEAAKERVTADQKLHWATCECGPQHKLPHSRRIRVSHATLSHGAIICGICGARFEIREQEQETLPDSGDD